MTDQSQTSMDEIAERERQAWAEVPSHNSVDPPDNGTSGAQEKPSSEITLSSQESQLQPDDAWIVVMGMTGVGKSTLISEVVGHDVGVGHELQSMTQQLGVYKCQNVFRKTIWLVDTPGFDDSFRSNVEVLQDIATFFAQLYDHKIRFSGVLYLHRITDPRMSGTAIKNLEVFKLLCGVRAFPIIRLLTMHWNTLSNPSDYAVAAERETELANNPKFFQPLLKKGSRLMRHELLGQESAKAVIDSLLEVEEKADLSIQVEMVAQKKTLKETTAGRFLEQDRRLQRQKYDAELRELQQSMEEALRKKDREALAEMSAEKREFYAKLERLRREREEMKVSYQQLSERDRQGLSTGAGGRATAQGAFSESESRPPLHVPEQRAASEGSFMVDSSLQGGQPPQHNLGPQGTSDVAKKGQRYYALERGTLRETPGYTSEDNQVEKIKKWLYRLTS